MNYSHDAGMAYAKQLGMEWDAPFAARADAVAHEHGITQEQFDVMVREYSWKMRQTFTPANYPWHARLLLALHFVNPFNSNPFGR